MRQLEIIGARWVEWREVPAPRLQGDGEALVRPLAVAMCDLDAVFLSGGVPIAEPFALGHECVAEVLEVGDGVTSVAPGDRVVVPFQISCGTCAACAVGRTASCRTVPRGSAYGMQPLGGELRGPQRPLDDRLLLHPREIDHDPQWPQAKTARKSG
jgi:alcohol dehydrogenase